MKERAVRAVRRLAGSRLMGVAIVMGTVLFLGAVTWA